MSLGIACSPRRQRGSSAAATAMALPQQADAFNAWLREPSPLQQLASVRGSALLQPWPYSREAYRGHADSFAQTFQARLAGFGFALVAPATKEHFVELCTALKHGQADFGSRGGGVLTEVFTKVFLFAARLVFSACQTAASWAPGRYYRLMVRAKSVSEESLLTREQRESLLESACVEASLLDTKGAAKMLDDAADGSVRIGAALGRLQHLAEQEDKKMTLEDLHLQDQPWWSSLEGKAEERLQREIDKLNVAEEIAAASKSAEEAARVIAEQSVAAEKMLDEISAYIEQNFGLVDVARCAGHAPPRVIEVLEKWRRAQKKREDFFSKPKRRAGLQRSDPRIDLALFDVAPHFAAMLAHICPHNDSFLPSHLLSKSKARSQNHCCVQGARQPAASGRRRKPSARYVRTSTARCCCSSR